MRTIFGSGWRSFARGWKRVADPSRATIQIRRPDRVVEPSRLVGVRCSRLRGGRSAPGGIRHPDPAHRAAELSRRHRGLRIGLGLTAYTFGLRHAFDADHIAAIDNTTRKLTADGSKPKSIGFWFAMGHSMMVLVLALLVVGATKVAGELINGDSGTKHALGVAGTLSLRAVPLPDRRYQHRCPAGHLAGLPVHAPRNVHRRRVDGTPGQPRIPRESFGRL